MNAKMHPLNNSMKPVRANVNHEAKVRQVSELYEKQFLREMVTQMRKTVSEGGFLQANMAEKIFRDKLDHEYVEIWGSRGGIGLADMIYEQLIERFGVQLGIKNRPEARPQGPLPMQEGRSFEIKTPKSENPNELTFIFQSEQPNSETNLTMPWSGQVSAYFATPDGKNSIEVKHDNGMTSQLVFKGKLHQKDGAIDAGTKFATLSPSEGHLIWRLREDGTKVQKGSSDNASADIGAPSV